MGRVGGLAILMAPMIAAVAAAAPAKIAIPDIFVKVLRFIYCIRGRVFF
jgi:hypothetical protein